MKCILDLELSRTNRVGDRTESESFAAQKEALQPIVSVPAIKNLSIVIPFPSTCSIAVYAMALQVLI